MGLLDRFRSKGKRETDSGEDAVAYGMVGGMLGSTMYGNSESEHEDEDGGEAETGDDGATDSVGE